MPIMPPRHELKYFIAVRDTPGLADRLGRVLARDAHADDSGEYMIRSLYFDDAYNTAYFDKLDGVADRDKYRIRVYNLNEKAIYLERKHKVGDLIQKDSVHITRRLAEQLMAGEPTGLEKMADPLMRDMFVMMRLRRLRPVVIVDYDREAYRYPVGHTRVTLDKRVRTGTTRLDLFDRALPTVPAIDQGLAVLEVKYDNYLPDFIPPLLSVTPAERSAISKYVLCRRYA